MRIQSWNRLSTEKQNLYLTLLWRDGYSEKAIATFFRTTKGRIVHRRQAVLRLPTGDRPLVKSQVHKERFIDLLDIEAMDELATRGVLPLMPPTREEKHAEDMPGTQTTKETVVQDTTGDVHTEEETPSTLHEEPEEETCRWALSSPTTLKPVFCGKPVVPGHALCEEHLKVVQRNI